MTLHTYRREGVSLADALAAFAADAVALIYAPRWCGFAKLTGGKLSDSAGPVPNDVYEVRAFNRTAELRWLKDPTSANGTGNAAILCETEVELPNWVQTSREVDQLEPAGTYLLWGEGAAAKNAPAGWSALGTARIGALPVPLAGVGTGARVLLHAVEYIAEDAFGSAFVCEERLTKLTISTGNDNG
jgi:CRISPR-associated protein (TIGR03984 family)